MGIEVLRTDSGNSDFIRLIRLLDEDLEERYGVLQKQFDAFNKVDLIRDVVVVYKDGAPVACGAFKEYDSSAIELKRIFVKKRAEKTRVSRAIGQNAGRDRTGERL